MGVAGGLSPEPSVSGLWFTLTLSPLVVFFVAGNGNDVVISLVTARSKGW